MLDARYESAGSIIRFKSARDTSQGLCRTQIPVTRTPAILRAKSARRRVSHDQST